MFQRTPSTVDWRRNKPTDPEWFASLEPGWQRRRRENFTIQAAGKPVEEDLIDDGWTSIFRAISSPKGENRPKTREERNLVVAGRPVAAEDSTDMQGRRMIAHPFDLRG